MKKKYSCSSIPNAQTHKTIEASKKGIGIKYAKDAYDLFEQCGIKIKKSKRMPRG